MLCKLKINDGQSNDVDLIWKIIRQFVINGNNHKLFIIHYCPNELNI